MPNPSTTLQELESTLRLVIETLIDGQEGFQKIGDNLKDETLKRYFLAESLCRAQFRGELETVLHQEGVHDIHERGTASGTVNLTMHESVPTKGFFLAIRGDPTKPEFAPIIATWLAAYMGGTAGVSAMLILLALITLVATFFAR